MSSLLPNHIFAVILAGGSGTRFWPKSRHKLPKQLCKIGNNSKTMLEMTLERLEGFIPPSNRVIITHRDQAESTMKIVEGQCAEVISEPAAMQTISALALGAFVVDDLQSKGSSPSNLQKPSYQIASTDPSQEVASLDCRRDPKETFL